MAAHPVARAADLPPGSRLALQVAGRPIVVFNVDGTYFAVLDRCPHEGGRLSDGYLIGRLKSPGPGEYSYDPRREVVRCPWHSWEFDLRTGESRCDPAKTKVRAFHVSVGKLETYPVAAQDEWVVVDL